jgi:anti-anti-sigma factor
MLTASTQQHSTIGSEAFSVGVHPDRAQVAVAPAGELDLATVAEVERELSELRAAGFTDVVLDLRRVTFMDSSGLALLLSEHRMAQAAGHRFRLVEGSAAAARLLDVTGTADIFEYVRGR